MLAELLNQLPDPPVVTVLCSFAARLGEASDAHDSGAAEVIGFPLQQAEEPVVIPAALHLHTPSDVHHGRAPEIRRARAQVLQAAYQDHPERFVRKTPEPPALPGPAWINKPTEPRVH